MLIRQILMVSLVSAASLTFAGSSFAAGGGGGGTGATTTSTASGSNVIAEPAPCIPRGEDGKPVRKLSSEDGCPMYMFWRDDCRRDGATGIAVEGVSHCTMGAMGLRRDDEITTGSIVPAAR
jgi:hypothetical protein